MALGYSPHAAHEEIAKYYNVHPNTVYCACLGKKVPCKHEAKRTCRQRAKKASYKEVKNFHQNFKRNPARYLAPLFSDPNESLSLEELSVRVKDHYGYLPHIQVLEQMLTQENPLYRGKTSRGVILEQVSSRPVSLYCLVEGIYERYKCP